MSIESYRDLRVWTEVMTLAEDCYRLTGPLSKVFRRPIADCQTTRDIS